ncbi:MAG: SDR family oxidoreductase [Acidisphaera sp.]|nr:SDR family oxidoreductase [Acidisphaera sp.]
MRLRDKTALVTGAASGIGRACATRFAREGARVALVDIDRDRGQEVAAELAKEGEVAFFACDVGFKDQVDATVDSVLDRFGHVDVLLSNAGIMRRFDFLDLSETDFDDVIRTNLKSIFLFGQAVGRHMASRRSGVIINMSSTSVVMTMPTLAAYAASKGGISSLTRAMAISLAKHGIRVNAIGPGTILTELNRTNLLANAETRRSILSRTPLMRLGEGDDVAGVAMFLATDDSAYVSGQTVYVDGGRAGLNYILPVPAAL